MGLARSPPRYFAAQAQQLGVKHATACCGVINVAAAPAAAKAKTANARIFFMLRSAAVGRARDDVLRLNTLHHGR